MLVEKNKMRVSFCKGSLLHQSHAVECKCQHSQIWNAIEKKEPIRATLRVICAI